MSPDHKMTTYIRAVSLSGFDSLVKTMGGDPAALLQKVGLPADAFERPDTLVPFAAYATLLDSAAAKLNRPAFGLELSRSLQPHFPHLGGLLLSAKYAPLTRDWIDIGTRYWQLHTNGHRAEFLDDGHSPFVILRNHVDARILNPVRQFFEHAHANQVLMARQVTGFLDENPICVRFQHARPRDISTHEDIFRCPIEFDAPYNEVIFDRKYLNYPANGNVPFLKSLVDAYVRYRLKRMPVYDQRISTAVLLAIPSVIGTGDCSVTSIAAAMEMNPKKLQRALTAEGTSFSELLEQTRLNQAHRFLIESNAPVSKIAGLLDYSGIPAFTLAFKRWTNTTPLAYRKRMRLQAVEPSQLTNSGPG